MTGRPREGRERGDGPQPRLSLTPVVRGGLTGRVLDQLRQRIADGTWALNERLPVEAALARELGVGRSTIREAVRVLEHAGQVEVRQGDGTYVRARREIDVALQRRVLSANLLEAFEVRRGLDVEVARLAALHRTDADVVVLREIAKRRDEARDADRAGYRRAEQELREHVLAMTGNALLADLHRGFVTPLRAAVAATFDDEDELLRDPDRPETAELVAAIEARDADAAGAAAARRLDNALRLLRFLLQVVVVERADG